MHPLLKATTAIFSVCQSSEKVPCTELGGQHYLKVQSKGYGYPHMAASIVGFRMSNLHKLRQRWRRYHIFVSLNSHEDMGHCLLLLYSYARPNSDLIKDITVILQLVSPSSHLIPTKNFNKW